MLNIYILYFLLRSGTEEEYGEKQKLLQEVVELQDSSSTLLAEEKDRKKSEREKVSLNRLPKEVLLQIFSYLEISDVLKLGLCNSVLYKICTDDILWKFVRVTHCPTISIKAMTNLFIPKAHVIKELELPYVDFEDESFLVQLLKNCNLHMLNVMGIASIGSHTYLFSGFQSLYHLNISGCNLKTINHLESCTALLYLNISFNDLETASAVVILKKFINLQVLDASGIVFDFVQLMDLLSPPDKMPDLMISLSDSVTASICRTLCEIHPGINFHVHNKPFLMY